MGLIFHRALPGNIKLLLFLNQILGARSYAAYRNKIKLLNCLFGKNIYHWFYQTNVTQL